MWNRLSRVVCLSLLSSCISAESVVVTVDPDAATTDAAPRSPDDAVTTDARAPDDVTARDVAAPLDAPVTSPDVVATPDAPATTPGGLCAPCAVNEDCATGGLCLFNQRTGIRVCGAPCDARCTGPYVCIQATVMGSTSTIPQCVPASGTCDGTTMDAGPARDVVTVTPDVAPPRDTGPVADVPVTGTLPPGASMVTLGGRTVLRYVPTSWHTGSPAMVALHGNGDTAANFFATAGLQAFADRQGVAIALPQAISGSGPMGVDWDAYTRPAGANGDLTLVQRAREHLASQGADPHRIYLLGYSQGGYLAFHAAMALSTQFAAVNVSAAADPLPGLGLAAMAARQIPMDLALGTADYGIANARSTAADLRARSWDLQYTELPGVGHCCPSSVVGARLDAIWAFLSARRLP